MNSEKKKKGGIVQVNVLLDKRTHEALKMKAKNDRRSVAATMRHLVDGYVGGGRVNAQAGT